MNNNYFEYPLNTKLLFRKKNKIKDELIKLNKNSIRKKIAILGGSTTNEIVEQMELFLLNYKIVPEFYQSEYNQYWQDAVWGNSRLNEFCPDIIFIHTSWRNIEVFPSMENNKEEVDKMVEAEFERFVLMWENLAKKFSCPIIQNNFDRPNYRLLGNRDIWDYRGRTNYISRLNQKFYEYAQSHENFFINDLDYLAANYGLLEWGNPLYWYMYKYAMCINAIPYVAKSIASIIKSIYGMNKKVLLLDLDNTLWGGIIGDDGIEGIEIGEEMPRGQAYSEFQKYCKELKKIGVILGIVSKNNFDNAIKGLEHPDSILQEKDFVIIKANWESKDKNTMEIAKTLALNPDSFVFFDDNPVEQEIIRCQLPVVSVPAIEKVEEYIYALDQGSYFEVTTLSNEDMKKTEMYHAKIQAYDNMAMFTDYGAYLDSLNMVATITDFKPEYIQRITQLTNKSNQFNLTTLRCNENDIIKMRTNLNYICLCGRLEDRFINNGIVTVVAAEMLGKELHIRLWLMSCRVLKRDMENIMMNNLVDIAAKKNIQKIIGYYYPTAKNGLVKEFYDSMGFTKKEENLAGEKIYELLIKNYTYKEAHIQCNQDRLEYN